jgi:hypothetical protein
MVAFNASGMYIIGRVVSSAQKTLIAFVFQCLMVYVHCIMCQFHLLELTYVQSAWITNASYIHTIFLIIVFTISFSCLLADTINGIWFHYCVLWGVALGVVGPKTAIELGQYTFYKTFFGCIQHIKQAFHI